METKPTPTPRASALATKDIWLLLSSLEPTPTDATSSSIPSSSSTISSSAEERDTFTLLVGSKSAGKTSLCAAFLHRSSSSSDDKAASTIDDVKPTTGLEYLFVRSAQNGAVAHIWELAATQCVPEMMRVPLAPARIFQSACVVAIDLSNPGDALLHLLKYLTTIHHLVAEVLAAKAKNPVDKGTVDKLKKQAFARYGKEHDDRDDVSPIVIPVVVLGTKLDVFGKEDSARRKPLQQALRFFCHFFGATLLCTSVKEKPLVTQMRTILKHYVLGTAGNLKGMKKEVEGVAKPLFVPAGSDRFDDIGLPDGTRKEDLLGTSVSDMDAKAKPWKKYVAKVFPPSGSVRDGWDDVALDKHPENPENGINEFPEPNVDRARQRKRDELQRYRDASRKKDKLRSSKT